MKNLIKLFVIAVMVTLCFVPFSLKSGIENVSKIESIRRGINRNNSLVDEKQTKINNEMLKLDSKRSNLIPIKNKKETIKSMVTIPGVDSYTVTSISFEGTEVVQGEQLKDESQYDQVNAVEISVATKDIDKYLTSLDNLKLPFYTLNVVYASNKVVIRFDFSIGGGV